MTASPETALPARLASLLDEAGWNLRAAIPAERWDALVAEPFRSATLAPGARSVLVLASGGRALWSAFRRSPEFGLDPDPLDRFSERVAGEAARLLGGLPVLAHEPREGVFADLVAAGVAAGIGVKSRLALLVHPTFGPWLSIRAAVLTRRSLPLAAPLAGFDPCRTCPAPCAEACPGAAVPPEGLDPGLCAATRAREPACAARCGARRACVLGPEHAYEDAAEGHHLRHLAAFGPA